VVDVTDEHDLTDSMSASEVKQTDLRSTRALTISMYPDITDSKQSKYGKISVHEPELRGTNRFNRYHAYKITAPQSGIDHVFRRFKDFVWLQETLVKFFPGVFIPPLPPKKILGSLDNSVVAERRIDLERFLNRAAAQAYVADSEAFTLFVTRTTTFEDAVKDLEKKLAAQNTNDTLRMYDNLFPEIMKTVVPENAEQQVNGLNEFLTLTEERVSGLVNSAKALCTSHTSLLTDLHKINEFMSSTYTVEKGYPDRPQPSRVDVMEQFSQWEISEKQSAPSLDEDLFQTFKYELQDVQGFLELLKVRRAVLGRKVKAVEKAAKWKLPETLVDTGKKEALRTQDIQKEKEETDLLDAMTRLILTTEIQRFWTQKTARYKTSMARFAKEQLSVNKQLGTMWDQVVALAAAADPVVGVPVAAAAASASTSAGLP